MRRVLTLPAVGGLVAMLLACGGAATSKRHPPKGGGEVQGKREREIEDLQGDGVLRDVSKHGVWVTPKFLGLDFRDRQEIAELCFCYCYDLEHPPTEDEDLTRTAPLPLFHTATHKEVGRYVPGRGLRMD